MNTCKLEKGWLDMTPEEKMFNTVISEIREKMIEEEGIKYVVYKDTLGKLTGGIGHLILPQDNLRYKDRISKERVEEWFIKDVSGSIRAAIKQAKQIGEFEKDFIIALTSVNFQLGVNWYKEWPNTWAALVNGNYQFAINAVARSKWARQTPARTEKFIMALMQEQFENNRTVST